MGAALKVLVVANPIAGGAGRGRDLGERLAAALRARGHAVELFLTDAPDAARRRLTARDAGPETFDRIAVVGGDGTLAEVVDALPDPGQVPLALLATGTANMLARELDLPVTPEAVVERIERGEVRRLDLARAGGRRMVMNASAGFDALVVQTIALRRTGHLGFRGYALPILRALGRYHPPRLAVVVEGGPGGFETLPAALCIVSNIRNYGGLFSVTDRARPDDGLLDVVACERARVPDLLRYVVAARRERVSQLRDVAYRTATRVRITGEPAPVQIDGDWRGTVPLEIEIEPAALAVLV